jgi:hypothetical protein
VAREFFFDPQGPFATPLPDHHKCRNPAEFSGFVLNAPLSSAICR